jgi:hypothetical protein
MYRKLLNWILPITLLALTAHAANFAGKCSTISSVERT